MDYVEVTGIQLIRAMRVVEGGRSLPPDGWEGITTHRERNVNWQMRRRRKCGHVMAVTVSLQHKDELSVSERAGGHGLDGGSAQSSSQRGTNTLRQKDGYCIESQDRHESSPLF